jgi:hypothetical protein
MRSKDETRVNSNFKDLLSALNARRVRYVIVGGYAVIAHTEPRYTKDLDILVEPTLRNAKRVHSALAEFMGDLDSVEPGALAEPGVWLKRGRAPVRIDILTSIPAVRFETAWKNRVSIDVGGVKAKFLSRRDLIRKNRRTGTTSRGRSTAALGGSTRNSPEASVRGTYSAGPWAVPSALTRHRRRGPVPG